MNYITGALDKVTLTAKKGLIKAIEPEVHLVISEQVTEFQNRSLRELPESVEDSIQKQSGRNPAAWVVYKALGEDTSDVVQRLVEKLRPGITDATSDLSTSATAAVMENVREALGASSSAEHKNKADDPAAAEHEAGAAAEHRGAGAQQQQQQQLYSAEQRAQELAEAREGSGGGRGGGLTERLPGVELSVREVVHPLFVALRARVEALVPGALREVLLEVTGATDTEAAPRAGGDRALAGGPKKDKKGGLLDKAKDWLEGATTPTLDKAVGGVVDLVDGPIQTVAGKLVSELEENSMTAALTRLRRQLGTFHLITRDAAHAVPAGAH